MDLLQHIELNTGPDPVGAIIWMHGLGADGWDFVPIVRELPLPDDLALRFIFPHAPVRPVTINNGMEMRAWYDIAMSDIARLPDEGGIRESQAALERLIARERDRGIESSRIVLAGFSQGCAMTLQTGLRHPEKLAGLMCLSGYVPLHTTIAAERHAANQSTPIFLAHGRGDQVIPVVRARSTMLPRSRKSLNPLSMRGVNRALRLPGQGRSACHGGGRVTVSVDDVAAAASRAAVSPSTATTSRPAAASSTGGARWSAAISTSAAAATITAADSPSRVARTSIRSPVRTSAATARSASRTGAATCPAGSSAVSPAPTTRTSVMISPARTAPASTRPATASRAEVAPTGTRAGGRRATARSVAVSRVPAGRSAEATTTGDVGPGASTAGTAPPRSDSTSARASSTAAAT